MGILPSFIWLLYFLRKDVHPEPNRLIIKVFFWGMLAVFPAYFIEVFLGENSLSRMLAQEYPVLFSFLHAFIVIALVEEYIKYRVVRDKILRNPEFNEPVDAMLYMIIAALGFAAMENIFAILPEERAFSSCVVCAAAQTSSLRFITAIFLHALASALVGFSLAFRKQKWMLPLGISLAVLLHGAYNLIIISIDTMNPLMIYLPFILLIVTANIVAYLFRRVRMHTY